MYSKGICVLAHTLIIFKVQINLTFTAFVLNRFLIPLEECMQLSYPVIYFVYLCVGK
jgi:hypothetical protein